MFALACSNRHCSENPTGSSKSVHGTPQYLTKPDFGFNLNKNVQIPSTASSASSCARSMQLRQS